jgi:LytS/YehU family sensor histidine kinase
MHPIFSSAKAFGLYLAGWLLPFTALALILTFHGGMSGPNASLAAIALGLSYALICLSPWYVCRMLPLRDEHLLKALLNHVAAAFLCAVLWTRLAGYLLPDSMHPQLALVFATGVLLYLLSVAVHYIYLSVESSKDAIRREQQARVLAREAELKALKAQINPHFLFNCLHSISALTTIDAGRAREMCLRLSDFLRNTLRLGEKESIPFSEELALVNTYLAVEQVRFGSRLKVEREIQEVCERCTVPPLLLQPLIENSVKHGIAGLVDGGTIRLHAFCRDGMLRIEVENDFDPESPKPRQSGLGLANVRNRIATRHGDRGMMNITVSEGRHQVNIQIPCQGINP